MLIALRSGIGRISLDTPEYFDVVLPIDGVHGAVVLDYHFRKNLLFYADVNIDSIRTVDLTNYSNSKTIISTGLNTPNGLAVDWIAENIYFSDSGQKVIEVARLDGSFRKVLLRDNLDDPRAIILYPRLAYLFWADWSTPRIERCLFDGSDRKIILSFDIGFPTGLAIDFEAKRLFWADALQDKIESATFDGKNRAQVIPQASHPFGFTIYQNNIFYTDWYNKSVLKAQKKGGSNVIVEEIRHGLRGALDIRTVSKERQPYIDSEQNPCSKLNGDCSHLCLYAVKSYSCACSDSPDSTRSCRERKISLKDVPDMDQFDDNQDLRDRLLNRPKGFDKSENGKATRMVVLITTVLGVILLFVVIAIICKYLLIFFNFVLFIKKNNQNH